jgi:hypothetical protein
MMKKKLLKKRVKDLEFQRRLLTDLLTGLRESAQVTTGNYAMHLLICGITAEQAEMVEAFWEWADRQDKSTLTRERLLAEFDARAPIQLKEHLVGHLMSHREDGTKTFYCDLVLGKETAGESSTS